jgi:hypothetical protein
MILRVSSPQAEGTLDDFGYLFMPFDLHASKDFFYFGFPIFWLWAYTMKVIPETRGEHQLRSLRFYYT